MGSADLRSQLGTVPYIGTPPTIPSLSKDVKYLTGEVRLLLCHVNKNSNIRAGQMMALQAVVLDQLRRADKIEAVAWDTNIATTQATAANLFLGIAWEEVVSATGDLDTRDRKTILIECGGRCIYQYKLVSGIYDLGEYLGVADGGSSTLVDGSATLVNAVTTSAVARIVEATDGDSQVTTGKVQFASAFDVTQLNSHVG